MVYILLADGFEEVEAIAPLDILRRASYEVKTVSIGDTREVTGAHGITVLADIMASDATEDVSLLILPGGMPGTTNLDASPITDAMIKRTVASGGRLAAICAAPLILGKRGILKGKHATCFPGFEEYLEGAILYDSPVVTDGKVTTADGMRSAVQFGDELVKVLTTGCGTLSFETEDALILKALECAMDKGKISSSLLQRSLSVGYGKAAKLLDRMEELGFVSKQQGQYPRELLITKEEYEAFRKKCEDEK